MSKNRKNILFFAAIMVLFFIPVACMAIFGPSKAASNEALASAPKLMRGGKVNTEVLSDSASYFDDHFGLRQELITANSRVRMAVFGESAVKSVIAGEDGWLFFADTLDDYTGASEMSEREIFCAARNLQLMQEYAADNDAQFVFTAAPNKNALFADKMPAKYERSKQRSNAARLYDKLGAQGVLYCDLHAVFDDKEDIYYHTDSHWNGYGSALAHDALMQMLGKTAALSQETFVLTPFPTDLYAMLYPASKQFEQGLSLARERTFSYVGTVRSAEDMRIETQTEGQEGTLLMFRDSFGNALHEDLAESFASACFSRAMPYDLTMLRETEADTLMIELVERNLPQLAQKAAIFPAPVRAEISAEDLLKVQAECSAREDKKVVGCVYYTGTITGAIACDARIYLELDGACYEATLVGERGFALYAPAADSLQVLIG